jgi:hypothetical protein
VRLAELTGDDPAAVDRAIVLLGRLCAAKKKSGEQLLAVTYAIKHGLRIQPGSNNPKYDAAKEALERELGRLAQPGGEDDLLGFTPEGRAIRRDGLGVVYIVTEQGQRQPVQKAETA